MSTPNSMIRAGLDKGEGFTTKHPKRGMTPPRFAKFAGRRVGLTDLKISRNNIAKHHARLKEIRGAVTVALTEQETTIRAKYDAEGWLPGERDVQLAFDPPNAGRSSFAPPNGRICVNMTPISA
ncbi:MAG: hypothetical protein IID00_01775 [Chloroflexi bacterium]|nr:hypothetical protein [Chloroflexota bacterium]